MALQLVKLKNTALSHLEFRQYIQSQTKPITELPAGTLTDAGLIAGIAKITDQSLLYDKSLVKVSKDKHTEAVAALDEKRDASVLALGSAIRLGLQSNIPEEKAAAAHLETLYNTYGSSEIAVFNYEKESSALDNLIDDLENEYKDDVALLGIGKYVTRLKNDNTEFKALFATRLESGAGEIVYDAKKERKVLSDLYSDFAGYVLFNAKINGSAQFTQVLNFMNVTRKYYADLLAARRGRKEAKNNKGSDPDNNDAPVK
jgi:hypothetical protein